MTTVLVVNREEGTVAWLKSNLETAGFRVITARDGPTYTEISYFLRKAFIGICYNRDVKNNRCPQT
jgi:DNA-binding response OmpR family regulator